MATLGEQVSAELLRDMRLHKFTKLRATTHGTLYGFDRFRFSLPHNPKDWGKNTQQSELKKRWEELKSEMYEALPGYKASVQGEPSEGGMTPSEVDNMQPIESPEEPPENGHYKGWTCPKCNQTFKVQGRHAGVCDGTQTVRGPNYRRDLLTQARREQGLARKQPKRQTSEVRELLTKLGDLLLKLERERDEAVKRWEKVRKSLA